MMKDLNPKKIKEDSDDDSDDDSEEDLNKDINDNISSNISNNIKHKSEYDKIFDLLVLAIIATFMFILLSMKEMDDTLYIYIPDQTYRTIAKGLIFFVSIFILNLVIFHWDKCQLYIN
jgi:hypothetical protein